jgi:hypothetical protein
MRECHARPRCSVNPINVDVFSHVLVSEGMLLLLDRRGGKPDGCRAPGAGAAPATTGGGGPGRELARPG